MPLQFRRGTDSDRSTVTPSVGEPLFTTNTKKLFIGDGTTAGGLRIGLDSSEVLDIVNDNSIDSAVVENIIDSAYINLRTDANLDSDLTIQLIDSAYVQARQTTADLTNYRTFTQIQSMIDSEVNAVIDAAPGALDTLNELAAALGDDANFSTTITNQIAELPDSAQVATIVTSYGYTDFDSANLPNALKTFAADRIQLSTNNAYFGVGTATGSAGMAIKNNSGQPFFYGAKYYPASGLTDLELEANSGGKINVNGFRVYNVGTPTDNTDATTKLYVDNAVANAGLDSAQVSSIVTSYGYTTYDSANTLGLIDSAYIAARASNQTLDTTSDVEFNKVNSVLDGAIQFTAKNESGATLTKGTVVYISGVSGNTPLVDKADADDASKMPAFGIVAEDANNNSNVNVFTFGTLTGLDTSAYSAGDTLYVSTTAGELTNTAPTGSSSLLQNIGRVIRSDASAGSIKVGGAGRTNAVPNLDAGYIFYGNDSNRSAATDLSTIIDSDYVQARQTTTSLTGGDGIDVTQGYALTGSSDDSASYQTLRNIRSIQWKPDGTKLFVFSAYNDATGRRWEEHTLTTAWDISTASDANSDFYVGNQTTGPTGAGFSENGSYFYVVENSYTVYQYTLSTAWDVSTASYTRNQSFYDADAPAWEVAMRAVRLNGDGTKIILMDNVGSKFGTFDLSTAYDISSRSSNATDVTTWPTSGMVAFNFADSGSTVYTSHSNGNIYKWSLSTPYDMSTVGSTADESFDTGLSSTFYAATVEETGGKLYVVHGNSPAYVKAFSLAGGSGNTISVTDSYITDLIDSAYVLARAPAQDFLDSSEVINLIDSSYVQARQTAQDFAYSSLTGAPNVLDSANVISLITANDQQRDSAFVTDIIDSAYVNARVEAASGTDSATVVSIAAAPKEYIDTTTYAVTVASKTSSNVYYNTGSSLGYFLDGIETPFIEFVSGQTYVFDQSDTSNANHAIRFYYDVDKTTSYTSGVTVAGTAGSSGASTTIVVDDDTPSRLYYQCENHDKMGWAIGVDNHNVTGLTTDDLTEGSTNRYFSNTLAQGAFTGGTGVSISSGTISIGQPVGTSDNVSFGNLTLSGNLTVQGSTTYVQTETLTVDDNIIELNSNVTGAPTEDGGIEINRGTSSNVSLIWDEDSDNWKLTTDGTNYYKILTSNDNIAATDATTLDGQAASYYLNYNNFTNTPTSILDFSITDGNAGQALITDGSGNFTFSTISGGGGGGASGATTTARHQNVSTGGAAYGTVGGTYSDVLVYVNGILARDSDDYSFNDSSGIVTFITAPETGSEIDIIGIKSNTLDIDSSDNVTFNGDIKVGNHSNYSSGTTTGSSIVETTIDTFDATTVRGAKYVITAENDSDRYQISEALVVHDGTTATITTYGTINTGTGNLCVFDANYDSVSNVVELNATPTTINTVYKVVRTDVVI